MSQFRVSSEIMELPLSAVSKILERASAAQWEDVLPLAGGEPRFEPPQAVNNGLSGDLLNYWSKYSPFRGFQDLLEAIAQKLATTNRIVVDEERIICVPGGSAALFAAIRAVTDQGSEIFVSDPCWEHYLAIIALAGAQPIRFRMAFDRGRYTPDLDSLIHGMSSRTRAILVNTPLNPCGAVLNSEEIDALLNVAERYGLWIIVDEEYEAFIHGNNRHVSPASIDSSHVITLQSFSKTFAMTGIRLAYVVAAREITDAVRRVCLYTHMYPPSPSQLIAKMLLSGDVASYMEQVRGYYEGKMLRLYNGLSSLPGISCWKPEGGVYLFPQVQLPFGKTAADELINKYHLLCVPGEVAGSMGSGHVRLFYGIADGQIDEAVNRIGDFVRQYATV
jgi:aspartate/methionine/tyrosine aminotransferase